MKRAVSDEFWDFCKGLNQDVELYGPTELDWIKGALGLVTPGRHQVLRDYIDSLLRSQTDTDLLEYYDSTWREIYFSTPNELRMFLAMTRDVIDVTSPSEFGGRAARLRGARSS